MKREEQDLYISSAQREALCMSFTGTDRTSIYLISLDQVGSSFFLLLWTIFFFLIVLVSLFARVFSMTWASRSHNYKKKYTIIVENGFQFVEIVTKHFSHIFFMLLNRRLFNCSWVCVLLVWLRYLKTLNHQLQKFGVVTAPIRKQEAEKKITFFYRPRIAV